MLIVGASATVTDLTVMPTLAACFLIPATVVGCTYWSCMTNASIVSHRLPHPDVVVGGMRATLLCGKSQRYYMRHWFTQSILYQITLTPPCCTASFCTSSSKSTQWTIRSDLQQPCGSSCANQRLATQSSIMLEESTLQWEAKEVSYLESSSERIYFSVYYWAHRRTVASLAISLRSSSIRYI